MAGLPPQYGLSTAIVTPVITALFGSSWHLVSKPTLAISAVVFSTLAVQFEPGTPGLHLGSAALTLLAGISSWASAWHGSAPCAAPTSDEAGLS